MKKCNGSFTAVFDKIDFGFGLKHQDICIVSKQCAETEKLWEPGEIGRSLQCERGLYSRWRDIGQQE